MISYSLRTDSGRHIAIRLFFLRCFFHGETDQIDRCLTNSFDPEKIAVTIRSKDRTAEYSGSLITANDCEITKGALAEGDSIDLYSN